MRIIDVTPHKANMRTNTEQRNAQPTLQNVCHTLLAEENRIPTQC